MMKKVTVLLVVVMVLGAMSAAFASQDDWTLFLRTSNTSNAKAAADLQLGTVPGAVDGLGDDYDFNSTLPAADVAYIRCFDLGTGSASYGYAADIRSPLTGPGSKIIWSDVRLGVMGGWDPTKAVQLRLYNKSSYDIVAPVDVMIKVLSDPTGDLVVDADGYLLMDGSPIFSEAKNGSASSPAYSFTMANVAPLVAGEQVLLQVEARIIPEPGSIVAMLSGLVGLAGYGIRRRK